MDHQKQLKIKTGVVNRLAKDITFYKSELETEKKRLDGIDPSKIKQQQNVIQESEESIQGSQDRLNNAIQELKNLMESVNEKESEEYCAAVTALESIQLSD